MPHIRSPRPRPSFLAAVILALLLGACSNGSDQADAGPTPTDAASPTPSPTPGRAVALVAVGDSISLAGPDCGGCTSFLDLFGDSLGTKVTVENKAVPDTEAADVLLQVQRDAPTRAALEGAEVIVVDIGFNDTPWNRKDDPCRAAPDYPVVAWTKITPECSQRVTAEFADTLDQILREIDGIRAGAPTKLAVTTVYNAVLGNEVDESWDSPDAAEPAIAANLAFAAAQCRVATAHGGVCVDVGRAFNGAQGTEAATSLLAVDHTHPNAEGHRVIAALLVADEGSPTTSPSREPSGAPALRYVAFGDSWPEGAHCDGCQTFSGLWADGLEGAEQRAIEVTDLLGSREPGLVGDESETSATLLESLRTNETTRAATRTADIVLIATGPNELDLALKPLLADTCGGSDGLDCVRALGRPWTENFDAILAEISDLRAGRPTAIRLVSAANVFVSEPGINEGLPAGFSTTTGARIFELLADAMCDAAAERGAVCVDVRPILNGPAMIAPVDENAATSMRAVADALLATGLPELEKRASAAAGVLTGRTTDAPKAS